MEVFLIFPKSKQAQQELGQELAKSFLITIPPQLVRNFRDLRCVRKPQIELLGIQKLMRKDDRELENLKRRNF